MSNYFKSISEEVLIDLKECFGRTDGMISFDESLLLYNLAKEVNSGCIVEVGAYRGRSSIFLGKGSLSGAHIPIYAIDPHKRFTGSLGGEFGPGDRTIFYQTMLDLECSEIVSLINLRSEHISPSWEDPVSLLWIDGDHSYNGVKSDFNFWAPHLVANARIAFHDARDQKLGPYKLIHELTESDLYEKVMSVGNIIVLQKI